MTCEKQMHFGHRLFFSTLIRWYKTTLAARALKTALFFLLLDVKRSHPAFLLPLQHNRSGNTHSLLLSAGKLGWKKISLILKSYFFQCIKSNLLCLLFGYPPRLGQSFHYISKSRFIGKQIIILKDHGSP